jgi:threonine dehydratase
MITQGDLQEARQRVSSKLPPTPVVFSPMLSAETGAQVFLKLDNFQRTGSFKERGALNCLLTLTDEQKKNGVVTASAGNHAQAVAYHATQLGLQSTIFMPVTTPLLKLSRTEAFGAKIIISGENYDEAHEAASEFAREHGAFYVHAYDDERIVAGQATAGFEMLEQIPDVDVLVVPVGGGGLISGIALAVESLKRDVRVVGVETNVLPSMKAALERGAPFQLPAAPTLCDGIRVRKVGQINFDICKRLVRDFATVTDNEVALAILHLMEQEKLVAEGAGAAGVAAVLSHSIPDISGKTVCIIICGGNIDLTLLSRILERGMAETGRLVKLLLTIHDRPGELAELLQMIGKCEANVLEVHHERAFAESAWNDVDVDLVLETKGKSHIVDILAKMKAKGYLVTKVDNTGTNGWQRPHRP